MGGDSMEELQVVVFNVSGEVFGVETYQVATIALYSSIKKSDLLPPFADGYLPGRNGNIPVINLAKRLGLKETVVTRKTKVIVTNIEGSSLGFTVDDVNEILKVPQSNFEYTPAIIQDANNRYVKGVCKRGEKLIYILNLKEILPTSEINELKEKMKEIE